MDGFLDKMLEELRKPEIYRDLVPHVFFPRRLPSESRKEASLKQDSCLLSLMASIVHNFAASLKLTPKTIELFTKWISIQSNGGLNSDLLTDTIQNLTPGDFIAMYIRAQNAGLILSIPKSGEPCSGQVILSAFAASQSNETVMGTDGPLRSIFPGFSYHIPKSELLKSKALAKHLSSLCKTMEDFAAPHSMKAGSSHQEIRNVEDPVFITQWLPAALSLETSDLCPHFLPVAKKIRDKVVIGKGTLPFRRSGLWMTAKAVLQLCLTNEMTERINAKFIYKLIMLKLFVSCASIWNDGLNADIAMQIIGKIARRMTKLHQYALKNSVMAELKSCYEEVIFAAEVLVLSIRKKLDSEWKSYIADKSLQSELNYQTPLDFHESTIHGLKTLHEYLEAMSNKNFDCTNAPIPNLPCPPRHRLEECGMFPLRNFKTCPRDEESLGIVLIDFERNMEKLGSFYHCSDVLAVRELFETYGDQAKPYYKDDPVGGSRMILTLLQILRVVDEAAVKKYQSPALADYNSGVDPSVFLSLILPSPKEMKLARELENYFTERNKKANYISLIREESLSGRSFSVRYGAADPDMQKLKLKIQTECKRREEEKLAEVLRERQRCATLRQEARARSCDYSEDHYGRLRHALWCVKCHYEASARDAKVQLYERMLPSNTDNQNGVVFELMIPSDIACLRDMLFQFTQICASTQVNSGHQFAAGFWVQHLQQYFSALSLNHENVKLGSSSKLCLVSHYGRYGLHPDTSLDQFIVNNGYNCCYFYTSSGGSSPVIPSDTSIRGFCTFQVNASSAYQQLQFAVSGTKHSQNQVIARQIDCPPKLDLGEFIAFGSLRAGHELQWHNIHQALVQGTLSLESDSVFSLICQAVWQAGPKESSECQNEYWRDKDLSILDPNFAGKTLQLLESLLNENLCNWKNDYLMAVLIVLTTRIFPVTPYPLLKEKALEFSRKCRKVAAKWCSSIESLLTKMPDASKEDLKQMRMKIVQIAALSALTFTANREDFYLVLRDSSDLKFWLKSITKIHDNILLTESSLSSIPGMLKTLLRWVRKAALELEIHFQGLACVAEGYDAFVAKQLSSSVADLKIGSHKYEEPSRQVYRGESSDSVYQVDIITGLFHVNGKPVGKLHDSITRHPDFQRVFSGTIFEVREATGANLIPGSVSTLLKFNKCIYNFYMAEGGELVVREIHDNGDIYQLVSNSRFVGDIPFLLVHNYSHWRDLKKDIIQFRPIGFLSAQFTEPPEYTLSLATRELVHTRTNRNIVDINTPVFQKLSKIMERLEDINQILIFSDKTRLIVELPRMALQFSVDKSGVIESKEFDRMRISNTQQLDTLVGLQHGLLLTSLDFEDYKMSPVLLVPNGSVSCSSEDSIHHRVQIATNNLGTPEYFAFEVDHRMKRLRAGHSRVACLYLAHLHAVTANPMPDPFTEMTGTEVALQLLQSPLCWYCEPLEQAATEILQNIVSLSPKRVFYPNYLKVQERASYPEKLPSAAAQDSFRMIVQKIIADSTRPSFLFPSTSTTGTVSGLLDSDEELCLRAYRNHVLVSNEHCGIDPVFLRISKQPQARVVLSSTIHLAMRSMTSVRELAHCCATWTYTETPNDSLLVGLLGSLPSLNLTEMDVDISSDFYTQADAFNFKTKFPDSWFNLYKLARIVKTQGWKSEWALLLCQLGFGQNHISVQQLKILHAIAVNPHAFPWPDPPPYDSYTSTQNYTFNSSEITSIAASCAVGFNAYYGRMKDNVTRRNWDQDVYIERLKANYNHLVSEQAKHVANKLESAWPISVCDGIIKPGCVSTYEVIDMTSVLKKVNPRLSEWYANRELRSFLDKVESGLEQISQPPFAVVKNQIHNYDFNDFEEKRNCIISSISEESKLFQTLDIIILESQTFLDENYTQVAKKLFTGGGLDATSLVPSLNSQTCLSARANVLLKMAKTAILTSTDAMPFKNVLSAAGLFPRLTPTTLVPRITSEDLKNSAIRHLIGAVAVLWTLEQKQIRCEKYERAGETMQFALKKEKENDGHEAWNPEERPEWLLLELEMDIMIREIQVEVAERMMKPQNDESSVMQLNMGEGKTSVILPILIASLANGKQLARVTVLRSLFHTNTEVLRFNLGGLLKRRLYNLPCRRDMKLGAKQCQTMRQLYTECLEQRGFVVTLPEHRLSFQLKGYEKCRASSSDAPEFIELQEWLNLNARDILDESDEILNVKYQLIYTIGQLPIDGDPIRWTVVQKVLKLVPKHLMKIINSDSGVSDQAECRHLKHGTQTKKQVIQDFLFPQCRIFKPECYEDLCKLLAYDILSGKSEVQFPELNSTKRNQVAVFLTQSSLEEKLQKDVVSFFEQENSTVQLNTLLILRGLLACGVLLLGLTKRWRVNYGPHPKAKEYGRLMAVPYLAKDVASEKTEFGHPDVAILLTQLSYYYSGLSDSQLSEAFTWLYRQPKPELEYNSWVSKIPNIDKSIKKLSGVNLDDYEQRTQVLFPTLRHNTFVIDFWLNRYVYPRESKVFSHKFMGTPWDLASDIAKRPTTGFSGTNGTADLLPLHIKQNDLPKLEDTNAKVRGYILQDENNFYEALRPGAKDLDILQKLVDLKIPVLLDVGALILGLSNVHVAKTWLRLLPPESHIEAAIYFDEMNRLMVTHKDGRESTLGNSPYKNRLRYCAIYLDDIHTRGTDFKLAPGTKGCVTLGKGITRDKLVQGCMRLRQLGIPNGHSLHFIASHEVHNEITETTSPDSKWNERVMDWASINSKKTTQDGFLHWVNAGINYLRKRASRDLLLSSQKFQADYLQYGNRCADVETTNLKTMYGEFRAKKFFYKIADSRLKFQEDSFEATLGGEEMARKADILSLMSFERRAIVQKCQDHIPEVEKLAHLLDEEQERELEHKQEEEREADRPAALEPWRHRLDPALLEFVRGSSTFKTVKPCLVPVPEALKQTQLWSRAYVQPDCWGTNIFATNDFSNTVILTNDKDGADLYLRPATWIASFKTGNQTILILLSPFEANGLMPIFRSGKSRLKLHMFAPRLHPNQSTLLQTSELWVPSATASFNVLDYFQQFSQLNSNLLLFSGSQYFSDADEQAAYCQLTGYIPRPRSEAQQVAFEMNWTANGFVKPEFRKLLDQDLDENCKFTKNPEDIILGIIARRNENFSTKCHVSRIVAESSKETFGSSDDESDSAEDEN